MTFPGRHRVRKAKKIVASPYPNPSRVGHIPQGLQESTETVPEQRVAIMRETRGRSMRSPVWFTLLVMLAVTANAQQPPPAAFAQKVVLNIASQPVPDALSELGRQTGLGIVVYSSLGRGVTAPQLAGEYTPAEALERILAPAGLRAEYLDDKTVAVVLPPPTGEHVYTGVVSSSTELSRESMPNWESDSDPASDGKESRKRDLEEIVITGTHIHGATP